MYYDSKCQGCSSSSLEQCSPVKDNRLVKICHSQNMTSREILKVQPWDLSVIERKTHCGRLKPWPDIANWESFIVPESQLLILCWFKVCSTCP